MSNGPIIVPRSPVTQPNADSRRKSQKHFAQPSTYNAQSLNRELDYLHERLNQIAVQEAPQTLLPTDGSATLLQVVVLLNALATAATDAGLLRDA